MKSSCQARDGRMLTSLCLAGDFKIFDKMDPEGEGYVDEAARIGP